MAMNIKQQTTRCRICGTAIGLDRKSYERHNQIHHSVGYIKPIAPLRTPGVTTEQLVSQGENKFKEFLYVPASMPIVPAKAPRIEAKGPCASFDSQLDNLLALSESALQEVAQ